MPTKTFCIKTLEAEQPIDITAEVKEIVVASEIEDGLCLVMVLHTTAAVIVNESADPNIGRDVIRGVDSIFPVRNDWLHDRIDDNAHAHVKASVLGPSEQIVVRDGELLLGRWQAIWLLEFDGPKQREIAVYLQGA